MSSQPTAPTPGPVPVPAQDAPKKRSGKKAAKKKTAKPAVTKLARTLPNWRVGVSKQFDILRAAASGSAKGTKPVTLDETAQIAGLSPSTVIAAIPFLLSVELLKRTETGSFNVSAEAVSYLAAYEWDPNTAAYKVAPKLRNSWVGETLLPRLSYAQGIEEAVALNMLGEVAGASREYETELRMVLDFMVTAGIIQRDGNQIKQVRPSSAAAPCVETNGVGTRVEEQLIAEIDTPRGTRVSTNFTAQSPAGGVDFNISVHVDMAEFGNWHPERIGAFFRGIAEVLAAKAGIETGEVR